LPSGNSVCKLRMAVNTARQGTATSGQWDRTGRNYFDVTVLGRSGREGVARYLSRGLRPMPRRRPPRVARNGMPRTAPKRQAVGDHPPRTRNSWAAARGGGGRRWRRAPRRRLRTCRQRSHADVGADRRRRRHPVSELRTDRTWPEPDRRARPARSAAAPGGDKTGGKRKICHFCKDKVEEVDYKNANAPPALTISEKGKIRSRRHHRRLPPSPETRLAVAIKRAPR